MTLEYVLLLTIAGVLFMKTLMTAPSEAFNKGGVRLAAHSEGLHNDEPGSRAPFLVGHEFEDDLVR